MDGKYTVSYEPNALIYYDGNVSFIPPAIYRSASDPCLIRERERENLCIFQNILNNEQSMHKLMRFVIQLSHILNGCTVILKLHLIVQVRAL